MRSIFLKALLSSVRNGFSAVGACWTFFEITDHYIPKVGQLLKGNIGIMIFVFAVSASATFLRGVWVSVTCTIGETKITIKPGNIIRKKDGSIVVGINNQRKTGLKELAENSIHWQLVKKYGENKFKELFRKANVIQKVLFKETIDNKHFIFLCMSDVENGIARTTKQQLEGALKILFENQDQFDVFNKRIYFPILGTGGGGIGLSKQDTIKLEISLFLDHLRKKTAESIERIDELNIIVYWKDINQIDWEELETWLEMYKSYCMDCAAKEISQA